MSIWGNLVGAVALSLTGGRMLGPLDMNGQPLSGLNAPTAPDHAANKAYVDNLGKAKAGFIYPLASAVVPDGFLLCDGAAYSRTEYPELFAAIGTMYGEGDGSTTFNVPDLATRVPVGAGDGYALGDVGGEPSHALTIAELPKHCFSVYSNSGQRQIDSGVGTWQYQGIDTQAFMNTPYVGENKPHNNMQPYAVVHYIIATGKDTGVSVSDIVRGAQAIPLGIEYGGTDATNIEDIQKNFGIKVEKLIWKNASPSSNFPAQDLSFNLGDDKEIIAVFGNNSNAVSGCVKCKVGQGMRTYGFYNNAIVTRSATTSKTGISFSNALMFTEYSSTSTSARTEKNSMLIPYEIYIVD